MQATPEFRASERFSYEYLITIEDDPTLTQYYAESYNLSERGMYFKLPFELYPEDHVLVTIDDYYFRQNQVQAKVVWCKKLVGASYFGYGVGVKFLQLEKNFGVKASLPTTPQEITK
jgi:hypothetical protein